MPALESYYKKSVIPNNTTSAEVASALTDEVGTGFIVLSNSPNFTGTPTAPTAAPETNTTQIATTAFVDFAVNNIKTIRETVKNVSGSTLLRGTPVHVTGNSGNEAEVIAADAANNYPAQFILDETLIDDATGLAVALGFINNVSVPDASIYTPGQEVWLGSGGGWTTTKPTGTNVIQKLGLILKVNTGNNTISGIIYGLGMEEGLPNLAEGNTWVGDSNGVPQETVLGSAAFLTAGTNANNLVQLDSEGKLPAVDGSNLTGIGGGLEILYHNTATLNPLPNTVYILNTELNAITVDLPTAPTNGTVIGFSDYKGTFSTNNVTINRGGTDTLVDAVQTQLTLDNDFANIQLSYWDGNWSLTVAESFVDNGIGSGVGSGGLTPVPVTNADSPYTASANELLLVDTSAGAVVINLPASGSDVIVQVSDVAGNSGTNTITINRAGSDTILGDTTLLLDQDYGSTTLAIDSASTDWKIVSFTLPAGGSGAVAPGEDPTVNTIAWSAGGTIDYSLGHFFSLNASDTGTLVESNLPTNGERYRFEVLFTLGAGAAFTKPASWSKGDTFPTETGEYYITGITQDGGTSFYIAVMPA